MAADAVVRLDQAGAGGREAVGGKAASLGELARAGLPVPAGFAVTAGAFRDALAALGPAGAIGGEFAQLAPEDTAGIARAAARARERVAAVPLPGRLGGQITAAYRALGGDADPEPPVAVRSSATGEDSAAASFAGLQDTYLWVRGAHAVLDAVRNCWASLYNAESAGYRRRLGIGEDGLAMGVLVQRMVRPRSAGVMFTRSPVTGDRSVLAVEATWGLGSALVSGDVTPDSFLISKVTGEIVGRTVAAKTRRHDQRQNFPGVEVRAMPEALREAPSLSDSELRALARLGCRIEEHYGTAQDIEWALAEGPEAGGDGDGLVILQSRPATGTPRPAAAPRAAPAARPFDHVLKYLGTAQPGKGAQG
jgi:pyruvate, water dikinase